MILNMCLSVADMGIEREMVTVLEFWGFEYYLPVISYERWPSFRKHSVAEV